MDETEDESVHDPEERFRIEFFNVLMDQALMSMSERCEQFKGFQQNFGFLFKIPSLKQCRDYVLRKHCITLKDLLSGGNEDSAIDELNLFMRSNRLDEVFPNVTTALRILLTAPITVASAERSFSKLKLIKTFLRSTMSEDRLESLALISIEHNITAMYHTPRLPTLEYGTLIDSFSAIKARKIAFHAH